MSVQGKGRLSIGGIDIGEAQFEYTVKADLTGFKSAFRKAELRGREHGRHIHVKSREEGIRLAKAQHMCLEWCKCGAYMCAMRENHGGPFHAFKEHTCDPELRHGDPKEILLKAAEDSPMSVEDTPRTLDIEAVKKMLRDIGG